VEHKFKSAPERTGGIDVWCIYKMPNAEIKAPSTSINRDLLVIPGGCKCHSKNMESGSLKRHKLYNQQEE